MRRCVAVLGPGRSGTSIAMKLLSGAGLRLSADLVAAGPENPDGHFEDVRIRDAQQVLLRSFSLSPQLPRPPAWDAGDPYVTARRRLSEIVRDEVSDDRGLWGFKDPRTCVLWPLWQDVLSTARVEPVTVFCHRDAAAVIRSMMNWYALPQDVAEGLYLFRVFHALDDVTEGWFFVKYDEWFVAPDEQLRSLLTYCGLDRPVDTSSIVSAGLRPELDRQSSGSELGLSGVIEEVDQLINSFGGTTYDQTAIDNWCRAIKRRMAEFQFVFSGLDRINTSASTSTRPRTIEGLRKAVSRLVRR